jgi:hypothetical protein
MTAVGFLRIPGLGDRSAGDTATVHLPPVPLSCDAGRDLEDKLQGSSGVAWTPLMIQLFVMTTISCVQRQNYVIIFLWIQWQNSS